MIGFLNERSLEDHINWEVALQHFLEAAQELLVFQTPLLKDSRFFMDANFKKRFNSLSFSNDLKPLIRQVVFSDRYFSCWRPDRVSNDLADYHCEAPSLRLKDESICEATELKIQEPKSDVAVFSAQDSLFGDRVELRVSRESSGEEMILLNLTSVSTVKVWITKLRGFYDTESHEAPKDFQTILDKDPSRFHATGKIARHGSRRVFEEIATGRLYYVCDAHPGHSAHLEVFSPSHDHVGKANIHTGVVNESLKVKGRTLRL
jgi:hypothetical protein